ncbi:MAG: acyltransferase [Halobacteria archaeon]
MGYIGKRSRILGRVMDDAVVLGPSFIDNDTFIDGDVTLGYPTRSKLKEIIIKSYDELDNISDGVFIGKKCIIRRGSIIYENSQLEDEVELGHNVLVRSGSRIGRGTRIGSGAQIDGDVLIGKDVSIQSLAYIPAKSRIGNNVFIGPLVCVTNDRYPPSRKLVGVIIEDEAVIGAGSILLPGIRIGKGAVVAAGSIVTSDVEDNSIVLGSPARLHATRAEYEHKKRKYESG